MEWGSRNALAPGGRCPHLRLTLQFTRSSMLEVLASPFRELLEEGGLGMVNSVLRRAADLLWK